MFIWLKYCRSNTIGDQTNCIKTVGTCTSYLNVVIFPLSVCMCPHWVLVCVGIYMCLCTCTYMYDDVCMRLWVYLLTHRRVILCYYVSFLELVHVHWSECVHWREWACALAWVCLCVCLTSVKSSSVLELASHSVNATCMIQVILFTMSVLQAANLTIRRVNKTTHWGLTLSVCFLYITCQIFALNYSISLNLRGQIQSAVKRLHFQFMWPLKNDFSC